MRDFVPTNTDVRIVITGNSGGLYEPAAAALERNLFVDGRSSKTVAVEGVITSNSWGLKYNNDWFFTVGDGASSVGDITGSSALDTAIIRSQVSNEGVTIVVNPGTYTLTATGSAVGQRPKIMGNPWFSNPVINVAGTGPAGSLGHNGIHVGMELSNLTFNAVGSAQTIDMYPSAGGTDGRWHVSNCEFNDVTLNIEQQGSSTYSSVEIENCEFNQTGAFANTVSLVMTESTQFINVRSCHFHSTGYALYIGDVSSGQQIQRINIEKCLFDGVSTGSNQSIDANSPLGSSFNYYIYLFNGSRQSDVTFRDTTIRFVSDTSSAGVFNYEPLDSTISNQLIHVVCGTITVDNCKVFGPYQTYVDSGTWALPTWYVLARRSVQFLNSRIFGSLPVKINSDSFSLEDPHNVRTQFNDGAWLRIDGCEFSGYENISSVGLLSFFCPTTLAVELERFDGDTSTSTGVAMITNSSFYSTTDGLATEPTPAQNSVYTSASAYHTVGCVQIYGEGWTVHFQNNDVNSRMERPSGSFFGQAGVLIDTVGGATKDLADSNALVTGNRIAINSLLPAGVWTEYTTSISIISQFITVTGNIIRMVLAVGPGAGPRYLFRVNAFSSLDRTASITGNTFYYPTATNDGNMFDWQSSTKGMLVDNSFETPAQPGAINSATANDDWVFERNKSQRKSNLVRVFSGILTDGIGIHGPAKWGSINFVNAGSFDVADAASVKYNILVTMLGSSSQDNLDWRIPLSDVVPRGAKVRSISITADISDASDWTVLLMTLYLKKPNGTSVDTTVGSDAKNVLTLAPASTTATVSLSPSEPIDDRPYAHVSFVLNQDAAKTPSCYISALTVNYEW
jgi:hypothetical protein